MIITKNCMLCGKESSLEVSSKIAAQYKRYLSGIGLIQDIELPADQREFLKTGMCEDCQHMMFDVEEEEEYYG